MKIAKEGLGLIGLEENRAWMGLDGMDRSIVEIFL